MHPIPDNALAAALTTATVTIAPKDGPPVTLMRGDTGRHVVIFPDHPVAPVVVLSRIPDAADEQIGERR